MMLKALLKVMNYQRGDGALQFSQFSNTNLQILKSCSGLTELARRLQMSLISFCDALTSLRRLPLLPLS